MCLNVIEEHSEKCSGAYILSPLLYHCQKPSLSNLNCQLYIQVCENKSNFHKKLFSKKSKSFKKFAILQSSENFTASIQGQEFKIKITMQQSIVNTGFRLDPSTLIYSCFLKERYNRLSRCFKITSQEKSVDPPVSEN